MSEYLAWALNRARDHTLALVADVPADRIHHQSAPGERHPAWLLGHLLLADTYLLSLLGVQPLLDNFQTFLDRYGPQSTPAGHSHDQPKGDLVAGLVRTNALRIARVEKMSDRDLSETLPDAFLARAQPTFGHHLLSLVFHEGYHAGQLSAWRKAHGFAAVAWTFVQTDLRSEKQTK